MKTIEEYLKDLTAYDVTDGAIDNALINVGVEPGTEVTDLSVRERELCSAYIYMWCASTPSATASKRDSDGGWTHEEGSKQTSAYDKRLMRQMANDIFKKYGINVGSSTIKIQARGMRVFPRKGFN